MNIMYSSSLKYDVALKSYCHPALVNYKSFCDFWLKYYYLSHDLWLFWLFDFLVTLTVSFFIIIFDCGFECKFSGIWISVKVNDAGTESPKHKRTLHFFSGSHYSTNFEAIIGFDSAVESFSWSKKLSNSIQQKYPLRKFTYVLAIIKVCI